VTIKMFRERSLELGDLLIERDQHGHAGRARGAEGLGDLRRALGLLGAQRRLEFGGALVDVALATPPSQGRGDLGP
jgi:hypothetical protein